MVLATAALGVSFVDAPGVAGAVVAAPAASIIADSATRSSPSPRYVPASPRVYASGGVLAYGDASAYDEPQLSGMQLSAPVTAIATVPQGGGFWIAGADGGVYAFGNAGFYGSFGTASLPRSSPIIAMAATPDGRGYWLVNQTGGVYTFGDAGYYGSIGQLNRARTPGGSNALTLAQPIVGIAPAWGGQGYWLVGADGGVFAFGDARYLGSAAALPLAGPVMGIAATRDGLGYWLVGADGGVFAFGDAPYKGSAAYLAPQLSAWNAPVVGITPTPDSRGYWLASANGGVYGYGDVSYYGSEGGIDPSMPVNAIVATSDGHGYWLLEPDGFNYSFSDPASPGVAQEGAIVANADSQVAADPDPGPYCNPYGPCEAWCSLFSTWVWQSAGIPIPSYPLASDVYTWSASNAAVAPIGGVPLVGDAIMYGDGPPPGTTYHLGIVVQTWPSGAIVTIEGDSGPDLDGHYSVTINGPFLPDHPWAYNDYPAYAYAGA